MNLLIREFLPGDSDKIATAFGRLHDYVVSIDPIKRLRTMPGYVEHGMKELRETIDKQKGKIYIAEIDGEFVGFIAGFTKEQSQENLLSVIPTKLGIISDLYLEEAYRGQDIGSQLMKKMEEYLKSAGCDTLWIDVVAFNTKAHAFYKKMGYVDREICLIKQI